MGMPGAKLTQAMKQNGESVMVAFKAGSLGRYLSNIRVEVSVKGGILKSDGFTWHTSFLNKWFGSSLISETLCSIVGTVRPSTNISTASVHFHILMVVPWPKFSRIAAFNLAFKQISDGFFRWWALNKEGWYLGQGFCSKNLDLMMLTLRFGASLRCEYGLCQSTLYRISDSEAAPRLNLFPFFGCCVVVVVVVGDLVWKKSINSLTFSLLLMVKVKGNHALFGVHYFLEIAIISMIEIWE